MAQMSKEISDALDKVRVGLKNEGGDIEFVDLKNSVIYVRLTGACESCPMSGLTVKNWVTKTLLDEIPSLKEVKAL